MRFISIIFLSHVLIFSYFSSSSSHAATPHLCQDDQNSVLLQFMNESLSEPNPKLASWKPDTDCCSWEGITCGNATGHAITLDLSNGYLQGTIHSNSSLFKLHTLLSLDLSGNIFLTYNFSSENDEHIFLGIPSFQLIVLFNFWSHSFLSFKSSLSQKLISLETLSSEVPEFLVNMSSLVSIHLRDSELHGGFPTNLFRLPTLQEIDVNLGIRGTGFHGKIPESIGSLELLIDLDLNGLNFSGPIPNSIGSLRKLQNFLSPDSDLLCLTSLNLSDNSLDGVINYSLFIFPLLKVLDLHENRLQVLPTQLPYKPSPFLKELDLSDDVLQGPIPRYIAQLTSLEVVYLSSNDFKGSMDLDIPNSTFPQFQTLVSHSCNMVEFPTFLQDFQNLIELDVSNNRIKGHIPTWIWTRSLRFLNLSLNFLTGMDQPFPNASTPLYLLFLDLHSNNIQDPPVFPQDAHFLDFSNNSFTLVIPADIGSYLYNAAFFTVAGNKFHGEIPTSICSAIVLEVLDLSNDNLDGTIPSYLGNFSSSLSVLNLGGNGLKGAMPRVYAESLTVLVFNGNQLEGKVLSSLYGCQKLEVLDLVNNQINDIFPFRLENLQQLQVLILCSNRFYEFQSSMKVTMKGGEFQLERILDVFTSIDLSNNQLEGKIRVHRRVLSHCISWTCSNNLDGPIPSSLENVHQLESLALSNKKLSGEFPVQLTSLTFLSFLDLAGNNLEGAITSGGQLIQHISSKIIRGEPNVMRISIIPGNAESMRKQRHQLMNDSSTLIRELNLIGEWHGWDTGVGYH
ncbi:hypothetical protein PVL29_025809 [Vitis rotundifolia]|uniref:Leucine-rich repeat-containing N-terminal plant-type domain-containing protein n=1 Tax=Vitis rotundifolia TaxID=103349 RepID=A0AA39D6Z5_VITRO|nr:hypothetical protein PVL29_025809 [Vitis rotundifolia]